MRRVAIVLSWSLLVSIVAGIVLAAGSKLRETANMTQCRNNLRQISLGIENYYLTNAYFPIGTVTNPDLPPERRLSWMFEIDPFVHARMDPNWTKHSHEAWDSDGNLALQRGRMPWYECPRKPNRDTHSEPLGVTNHVGAAGIGDDAAVLAKTDPRAGLFGYDRKITHWDVTDGLSNTVMVIETLRDNGPWVTGGPPTVRRLLPDPAPPVGRDRQFGGQHWGGAMTVFADGSVHFVRSTVNSDVLSALFTIAGREVHESP